ncbi:cation:proton antiporter [Marinobacteraceae bacterium S3BR75-40.1]
MHEGEGLYFLLALLAAAVVISALFRRLNIPSTLAYLCVGMLVRPGEDLENIQFIGEFGIVFLLFTLGLEFSLPKLLALRQTVFVVGGLQVLISGALVFGAVILLGATPEEATVIAGALALSSTAVVSRELTGRQELHQPHGQIAIGILLFQDLAAVLLLILVPALAGSGDTPFVAALGMTVLKGVALFLLLLGLGKWVLPRLFDEVAKAHSEELFVLTVLMTSLLAAALTHFLGLSMALGAFIAGMMLSETHYRHQIEADIRPFRDLLMGLFFVSVGMMLDFTSLVHDWYWVIATALLLMVGKAAVIIMLVQQRGVDRETAVRSGLYLAQGGEFGFALFALAAQKGLLPAEWSAILVGSIVLSIAVTPWMINSLTPRIMRRLEADRDGRLASQLPHADGKLHGGGGHVVVCGFGRVGQTVARFLRKENIPYVAVDVDPMRVQEASAAGEPVYYGDATKPEILEALGTDKARLLVICHADGDRAIRLIEEVRRENAHLPILVRTRDDSRLVDLQKKGATEVIPETLEASLMLVSHVLTLMDVPAHRIFKDISETRRDRYSILHGYYHGLQSRLVDDQGRPLELLHPVTLPAHAWAAHKHLGEIAMPCGIYAIRRSEDEELDKDNPAVELLPGDTIVLQGPHNEVERAERQLLSG